MLSDEKQSSNIDNEFSKSLFKKFDRNDSGDIELSELTQTLQEDGVPSEVCKEMFNTADKNNDNALDYANFNKMVINQSYKEVFARYIYLYIKFVVPNKKHKQLVPDSIYEEQYSCWPPPFALILITLLELIFFIIDEIHKDFDYMRGPISDICIYDPFRRYQAWRYLTYMFVHIGKTHLVMNLAVQLFLGLPLEMVHRGGRVLIVYLSGVIAGSLGTSITQPSAYLAGASGGVYALIMGHIGTIIMNWNEMDFPYIQLGIFLIITLIDVGTAIYNKYIIGLEENIGYAAHISGAIAGFLVGIWILKNFRPTRKETYLWWCALFVYFLIMSTLILLNIFWTDHFNRS